MENENQNPENGLVPAETAKTHNELIWENHHLKIARAFAKYVEETGTKPSTGQIAQATGLSWLTVDKHIKAFAESSREDDALNSFCMMREHVMASVCRQAQRGNLKAMQIFLNATEKPRRVKRVSVKNNFVQIKNTTINQQFIQQLNPEQLDRLEQLIATEFDLKPGLNKKE